MENRTKKKAGIVRWFKLCTLQHIVLIVGALMIALHLLTRDNHALMNTLSERVVQPIHAFLAKITSPVPFSVAELIIAALVVGILVYIIYQIVMLFRCKDRIKRVYITIISLAATASIIYGGFCFLWGTYYYGDDFIERSGMKNDPISVEQLEAVTAYFAAIANELCDEVLRDENGVCCTDREKILAKSPEVFENIAQLYPFLEGPATRVKGLVFSRIQSYMDFTGFFFPFTAEANVNIDFPPCLLPSTVAHEISHQRGVAKEQEANFVAVLACLNYGEPEYCYSAALLAYTHLGNALHDVDYEAWEKIYLSLDENVLRDFAANRAYWQQFETPVQEVSTAVYEEFLQSYDQKLGMKSYGACVDLIVNYYYETAMELGK